MLAMVTAIDVTKIANTQLAAFGPPQHAREQAQVAGKIEILHLGGRDFVCKSGFGCGGRNYR